MTREHLSNLAGVAYACKDMVDKVMDALDSAENEKEWNAVIMSSIDSLVHWIYVELEGEQSGVDENLWAIETYGALSEFRIKVMQEGIDVRGKDSDPSARKS